MSIENNIKNYLSELPPTVRLAAVSKFHSFDCIRQAYQAGQRIFAESRPQELFKKVQQQALCQDMNDIEWHFIGHLQTNKLKMVLPYVSLVQSVDSLHLLQAIDSWGRSNGKIVDILLECHVSSDDTKQGFSYDELLDFVSSDVEYPFVHVCGVMGMATLTDDEDVIRADFQRLLDRMDLLQDWIGESKNLPHGLSAAGQNASSWRCDQISMGMTGDWRIAVEMGSTMVRIGSGIFGPREL